MYLFFRAAKRAPDFEAFVVSVSSPCCTTHAQCWTGKLFFRDRPLTFHHVVLMQYTLIHRRALLHHKVLQERFCQILPALQRLCLSVKSMRSISERNRMCAIAWKRRAEDMNRSSPNELSCYLAYGTGRTRQCKVEQRHLQCPAFISKVSSVSLSSFYCPSYCSRPCR